MDGTLGRACLCCSCCFFVIKPAVECIWAVSVKWSGVSRWRRALECACEHSLLRGDVELINTS